MLAHFRVTDTGVGIPPEESEPDLRGLHPGGRLACAPSRRDRARPVSRRFDSWTGWGAASGWRARWAEAARSTSPRVFEQAQSGQVLPDRSASPPADAFDREAALARLGGDEALLRDAVQAFLEDCPRLVGQLREAVERRDAAAVKAAAHAIKGTVAIFSAHPTHEAAARLERLGSQGQLAGIEAGAQHLEAELERFKKAAAAFAGPPPP